MKTVQTNVRLTIEQNEKLKAIVTEQNRIARLNDDPSLFTSKEKEIKKLIDKYL